MISTLSLEIENKGNCNNFRIIDTSNYNPNLPITDGLLQITPPGNCASMYFNTLPNFSKVFNASNLQIQLATNYESLLPLPDGIYYIKYSINPTDKLYVEYYYLHNCNQYKKYIDKACELYSSKSNLSKKEYNEKLKELREIKDMIDSIKYLVEWCDKSELGSDTYEEINTKLENFYINGCTNC